MNDEKKEFDGVKLIEDFDKGIRFSEKPSLTTMVDAQTVTQTIVSKTHSAQQLILISP
jgi:hypothetical protein